MIGLPLLNESLHSLVIFRSLLSEPAVKRFLDLLNCQQDSQVQKIRSYADFAAELYQHSDNLSDYLKDYILNDENVYISRLCEKKPTAFLEDTLQRELSVLNEFSRLTAEYVAEKTGLSGPLPAWKTSDYDFSALYLEHTDNLPKRGYGMYARHHAFCVQNGDVVPVRYPDPQRLSQMTDYELERNKVIKNTLALLAGQPASNALLYGDAGTGKSSTIKAIVNEYKDQGLRLIEVKKNQLYQIPDILERLNKNPLKFILFIDDLSFSSNDNDFAALKAILEGSISGKSSNVVVYATSNRRHLIKENFSDRDGDDIHRNDTMQELMSLSARFGLIITYQKPNKDIYLHIAANLAKEYGIEIDDEESFCKKAEAFAIRHGGRSPRTAKQFIELIKAEI